MRIFLALISLVVALEANAQKSCYVEMGDSLVSIEVQNPAEHYPVLFINVHENEITSVEAFNAFDPAKKFPFVWLKHLGTRRIYFNHREQVFSIDPNRIFSHDGIVATLAQDSVSNRKAERMAKALAHEILKFVNRSGWVLSLHNNTPDNYSILSYLEGGSESINAAAVYVNPEMDPDDFIYTTDLRLFDGLKDKRINVILQDNVNCFNDGSLSVYCGARAIPYANVEAEDGHFDEQLRLIKSAMEIIGAIPI